MIPVTFCGLTAHPGIVSLMRDSSACVIKASHDGRSCNQYSVRTRGYGKAHTYGETADRQMTCCLLCGAVELGGNPLAGSPAGLAWSLCQIVIGRTSSLDLRPLCLSCGRLGSSAEN